MWPFKRRPQTVVMIDQATLTAAIVDALAQADVARESKEVKLFKKDGIIGFLQWTVAICFFLFGALFLFVGVCVFLSFRGITVLTSIPLQVSPSATTVVALIIIVIYGLGSLGLGVCTIQIKDRVYLLSYVSVLTSFVAMVAALAALK